MATGTQEHCYYSYPAKESHDQLLAMISMNGKLPLHADITHHPGVRLSSRHPVWHELVPSDDMTAISERQESWFSADIVNQSLIQIKSNQITSHLFVSVACIARLCSGYP